MFAWKRCMGADVGWWTGSSVACTGDTAGVKPRSARAGNALADPAVPLLSAAHEDERGVVRVVANGPCEVIPPHPEADRVIFAEHGALLFCLYGGELVRKAIQGKVRFRPERALHDPCAIQHVQSPTESGECMSCLKALCSLRDDHGCDQAMAA